MEAQCTASLEEATHSVFRKQKDQATGLCWRVEVSQLGREGQSKDRFAAYSQSSEESPQRFWFCLLRQSLEVSSFYVGKGG